MNEKRGYAYQFNSTCLISRAGSTGRCDTCSESSFRSLRGWFRLRAL